MKVFAVHEISEAMRHAAGGGQALHLHRVIVNRKKAPACFVREVDKGNPIGHYFDQNLNRLRLTARALGVKSIKVERLGEPGQHVDLCSGPMWKAVRLDDDRARVRQLLQTFKVRPAPEPGPCHAVLAFQPVRPDRGPKAFHVAGIFPTPEAAAAAVSDLQVEAPDSVFFIAAVLRHRGWVVGDTLGKEDLDAAAMGLRPAGQFIGLTGSGRPVTAGNSAPAQWAALDDRAANAAAGTSIVVSTAIDKARGAE